ncbi:MBL fold metallo-hydrolase [Methylogaea oryzae]|uniref:MBL fold metallo-hydrolase n=1 Tax=Methylogaea oryzae TaxID=1295382 RepID=UPI0020D1F177|nr:MBL fold metallo-hydrolase [Methylogaea oryzae]
MNISEPGEKNGIPSNQYLVCHQGKGVLLDPGGFGVMPKVLVNMLRHVQPDQISAIILSHQDPDIVGGLSTWLELVDTPVFVSQIWLRFLPHYGISRCDAFVGVPDEGMTLHLPGNWKLLLLPAHFLHSEGQINVYDPISKVLFTGDIGAALMPEGNRSVFVDDFPGHIPYVEGFHKRYMCGNKAIRTWLSAIKDLEIDYIAPQHGPIYRGSAVKQFLNWLSEIRCGIDLLDETKPFNGDNCYTLT